ncbi:MAG: tRNA (N6-isopentenyl adenosine(37)-C2)-methylthiotransferase MiaB [Clostridia bacterium]|nr:tRNA (N6-isopentenyl adenosine(37)-C2)-methylthiotransferase MiaB [Clostridia bacterium]
MQGEGNDTQRTFLGRNRWMMERVPARELTRQELEEQKAYADAVRSLGTGPQTYCIVTYGCQMNERDSETLAGLFEAMGLTAADCRENADLVLFNTCCVRDNAQRRALGNVTWLKELKKTKPHLLVAVCGCMMQQPGMGEQILRQYPFVDLAFGTANLHRLPELLYRCVTEERRVIEVLQDDRSAIPEELPAVRSSTISAYVTIMYGCNNFCSYCIVPYVRGRERSRDSQRVLSEIRELRASGIREVMLLGQNVNSYGLDRKGELSFAQLLAEADKIGVPRLRFMTSHPKDISDELIGVMAQAKTVCHSLHLPAQHGSNRILAAMNRRYTKERYLDIVSRLRQAVPDIALSTDLIVGFPGETEEDFEETCDLVRTVGFDSAFTFIYSPRVGTPAAAMKDQVPAEVSSARIQKLIELQKESTRQRLRRQIGQVQRVLADSPSRRSPHEISGKNEYNVTVNFPADPSLIGQFVSVRIVDAKESTLTGERTEEGM